MDKHDAIVLRYYPTTNTSRIVHWLTDHHGRVTTIIKGSQRPKNPFLGQFDLFYTCELVYYHRDHREIHFTKEVSPLKWRPRLRTDWKACALASYITDLLSKLSPQQAPHESLFHLLDDTLDTIQEQGASESLMHWFELRILSILGLQPMLDRCAASAQPLTNKQNLYLGVHLGGTILSQHRDNERHYAQPLSQAVCNIMKSWQTLKQPQLAGRTRCTPAQLAELNDHLGKFLEYHLDIELRSRPIALKWIARITHQEKHRTHHGRMHR